MLKNASAAKILISAHAQAIFFFSLVFFSPWNEYAK
jgi:hypothetical protein